MGQRTVQLTRVVAVIGVLGVVAGCASSDKQRAAKTQLDRAQAAYQKAQADPSVQTHAQLRLADAQKALRVAEEAKDSDERLHLGYLAEKKARLASVTGAIAKTEQSMEQLRRETTEVLLQKRDRELKTARNETDAKAREAEQWRRTAEARARDAEARAREVEQGRKTDEADSKALAAEHARATALASELASLKTQQTDRGMVLTVGDVLFAPGKAEVGPGGQRSIDKLAQFLKAYPKRNVVIEGHSDNVGNEEFNVKLSQQRADAVRDLLVSRGVAAQRIQTKGYGPKFPVVDNDTAAGRQQNRRVEVLVLNEGVTSDQASRTDGR
jgi:outer membrane protein OmpA-like peptidoglycan-associated protein